MTSSLLFKLQENITTLPTSLYKNILLQILPFLWIQFEQLFYDYVHLPHLAQTSIPKYIEVNLNGLIFPSKSSLNISFLFFDSVIHETGANSWIGGHKKNFTLDFAQQSTTGNYLQMLLFLETKRKPIWTKTCDFLHIVEGGIKSVFVSFWWPWLLWWTWWHWWLRDNSWTTLGPLWNHPWTTLGALWDHSGTTLGTLWDHSGTTLSFLFCPSSLSSLGGAYIRSFSGHLLLNWTFFPQIYALFCKLMKFCEFIPSATLKILTIRKIFFIVRQGIFLHQNVCQVKIRYLFILCKKRRKILLLAAAGNMSNLAPLGLLQLRHTLSIASFHFLLFEFHP